MILLELLWGFLKVGCFSFGGAYAAIPLIRDVVMSYGWMDEETLAYMIAVSESTPGPIMINLATYVGSAQAGIIGSAVATLAVALPSFIIILAITALMSRVIGNRYVQAFLKCVKPGMAGIILAVGSKMAIDGLSVSSTGVDVKTLILTAILAAFWFGLRYPLQKKRKHTVSPIALIGLSAVLGVIAYGV